MQIEEINHGCPTTSSASTTKRKVSNLILDDGEYCHDGNKKNITSIPPIQETTSPTISDANLVSNVTPPGINHQNSKKRKGIPRRASLF